jgi:hypothetical protein
MPVNFDAALQADGSLLASRVEVTDTNTTNLTILRGPSVYLSAAEPGVGAIEQSVESAVFAPV